MVISDLAKDYNNLAIIIGLKDFDRFKNMELEVYIINLKPARKYTIYRRIVLDSFGLQHVLIGISTKTSTKKYKKYKYEYDTFLYLIKKSSSLIKIIFLKIILSF
jgi:hypothetical protein